MDDKEPPSDGESGIKNSNNTSVALLDSRKEVDSKHDLEEILLEPNPELGEIAVLNSAVLQKENIFAYRSEKIIDSAKDKGFQELTAFERTSDVKFRRLTSPMTLDQEWDVKLPFKYPIVSLEDPDISKFGNIFNICAVEYDTENAQIYLFKTKDFKTIIPQGIISPDISLKRAIEIVEDNRYKQMWTQQYTERLRNLVRLGAEGKRRYQKLGLKLWDKDMIFEEKKKQVSLIHRFFPDVHITIAENIKELQNTEYCEDYLAHITDHILITAKSLGYDRIGMKAKAKIGDKTISLLHGARKINKVWTYETRLVEMVNNQIVSITEPILIPSDQDIFPYINIEGRKSEKRVVIGSSLLVDEKNDKIYVYYNSGDRILKVKEFSATNLYEKLNHPLSRELAMAA